MLLTICVILTQIYILARNKKQVSLNSMIKYISTLAFIFLFTAKIHAQDSLQYLKEVTVVYQADKLTPVTYQNIKGADLKMRSTGQEPSFLLSELPSMTVYSDAGNTQGYSYFRMRGIDQTRINMTLDGVPLNEPEDQGAYFSNYPDIFNSVSKIQVQRGVGTTKNGVASYGGSIQLFAPNLRESKKATFGVNFGSFNTRRTFAEFASGIKNNKALYIRASQIHSDGYKYNSSNTSQSLFVSGGLFRGKSTWKINLMAGHQQNQLAWLGVPDSLISIDRRTNADKNERDNFTQCLAQLQHVWRAGHFSTVQTSVYYTFLDGNYDFNLNNFLGLPTTSELYNYAFRSNLIGVFSNYTFSKNNLNWSTGIHGNIYDRQHIGSERTLGQLYKNTGYKNEASAFTKIDYTVKRLTAFLDIQYRYSTFDYKGSVPLNRMSWQFVNPKAGISLSFNNEAMLYYSVGRTSREPTRNDMFGGNDNLLADSTGAAIISVKSPERVTDHELGFRFLSRRASFNWNLYYMDFQNEIVLDGKFGPNGLALTDRVDKSFRAGSEFSMTININKQFTLVNNSCFNYSRIKEQKEEFTPILTPPIIVNQEIVYSHKRFSVAMSARYQGKSFIDFANSSQIKDYLLFNSRVQYDLGKFQFGIFLNNISNVKYFNNGYVDFDGSKKYFVQAPANVSASIKYNL
jgi:iron complex outermembrane receptor protein